MGRTGETAGNAPLKPPLCTECEQAIRLVPNAGFGRTADWQHITFPGNPGHMARPKVFIT